MKRSLARTSVPVALLLAMVALSAPASAYPKHLNDGACIKPNQNWYFDTTWASYPSAKPWFADGVDGWNGLLDPYNGDPLLTVTKVSDTSPPAGSVKVTLVANGTLPNGAEGSSSCTGSGLIKIETRVVSDQETMQWLARHEMGHLLGMNHSGVNESIDGKVPTMATCLGAGDETPWSLSQDDIAYAHFLWSGAEHRQLNANYGFEESFRFWSSSGGQIVVDDTGGAGAPRRIRHKTTSSADYVKQTVRIATGTADDASYRATVQYKVDASNLTGHVRAIGYRARIDYGDSPNDCVYEDGLTNLNYYAFDVAPYNAPTYVAMVDTEQQTVTGKGSWTKVSSPWYDPVNAEGYQLELRVFSHAEDGTNTDRWVYLDNLRLESCNSACV